MKRVIAFLALLTLASSFAAGQSTDATQRPKPGADQTSRTGKVRVSGSFMLGMFDHKLMPGYPDEAMRKGVAGDVLITMVVDETGQINFALPADGDPLLVAASVEALQNSHFRPYLLNGTPVRVETQLGFHFSLAKVADGIRGNVECVAPSPHRPAAGAVENDDGVFILHPHKVSSVEPKLPPELAGKPGSVYLIITVGADGKVQNVTVVGGDEAFVGPVVEAAKQEVYEPRMLDGKPSVQRIETAYHFGPRR